VLIELLSLAGLAYALGCAAAWATTKVYALVPGVAVLAAGLGGLWLLARRSSSCVPWAIVPLFSIAAWLAGGGRWAPGLVTSTLLLALGLTPRAMLACGEIALLRRLGVWLPVTSFVVLGLVVVLGGAPATCLGAILAAPTGWRLGTMVSQGGADNRVSSLATEWGVAFAGAVMVGYLAGGLVN